MPISLILALCRQAGARIVVSPYTDALARADLSGNDALHFHFCTADRPGIMRAGELASHWALEAEPLVILCLSTAGPMVQVLFSSGSMWLHLFARRHAALPSLR